MVLKASKVLLGARVLLALLEPKVPKVLLGLKALLALKVLLAL